MDSASTTSDIRGESSQSWPVRMRLLLAIHLLLSFVVTWLYLAWPLSWWAWTIQGILPAQACLIGVWLGTGRTNPWQKCIAAVGGLVFLAALMAYVPWRTFPWHRGELVVLVLEYLGFSTAAALVTAALVFFFRKRLKAVLVSVRRSYEDGTMTFRLSTRHLLLTTFIVAGLLGLRTVIPPVLQESENLVGPLFHYLLAGIAYGIPTLAVVWGALGTKRPTHDSGVALLLALLAAILFVAYRGSDPVTLVAWQCVFATWETFAVIAVSLLIVRSAGYRLVQAANWPVEPSPHGL